MKGNELQIRPYVDSDRAAVVALWQKVFADDPPWNAPEAMIRRKLAVQPELFLVAVLGEKLVGTCLAGFDGVRGWIHHLAVAPSQRRQGIAARLVREAEGGLARLGCPKINLQVRPENREVVEFYMGLGYEVEGRVSMGKRVNTS